MPNVIHSNRSVCRSGIFKCIFILRNEDSHQHHEIERTEEEVPKKKKKHKKDKEKTDRRLQRVSIHKMMPY